MKFLKVRSTDFRRLKHQDNSKKPFQEFYANCIRREHRVQNSLNRVAFVRNQGNANLNTPTDSSNFSRVLNILATIFSLRALKLEFAFLSGSFLSELLISLLILHRKSVLIFHASRTKSYLLFLSKLSEHSPSFLPRGALWSFL